MREFRITNSVKRTAEEVNAWWRLRGYNDPYKKNTIVKEITLAENTAFVRVYSEGGSMAGGWVMRAEEVQGLTAQQIMDKFALPSLPKYICNVELEAGTTIRCGIAGEQVTFGGAGGGVQFDLMQQFTGQFTNQRLIQ